MGKKSDKRRASRATRDELIAGLTRRQVLVATAALGALPSYSASANEIQLENQDPGSPRSAWDITSANTSTEGFTTQMSVNRGQTIEFKIKSNRGYRIDIYRLGYYGGNGARLVHSIPNLPTRSQPTALT